MRVRVCAEAAALACAAADRIQAAARARPDLVPALPTGRTPLPLRDELHARHVAGALDLSRARASISTSWSCRPAMRAPARPTCKRTPGRVAL